MLTHTVILVHRLAGRIVDLDALLISGFGDRRRHTRDVSRGGGQHCVTRQSWRGRLRNRCRGFQWRQRSKQVHRATADLGCRDIDEHQTLRVARSIIEPALHVATAIALAGFVGQVRWQTSREIAVIAPGTQAIDSSRIDAFVGQAFGMQHAGKVAITKLVRLVGTGRQQGKQADQGKQGMARMDHGVTPKLQKEE